jgi:hypothetical protein
MNPKGRIHLKHRVIETAVLAACLASALACGKKPGEAAGAREAPPGTPAAASPAAAAATTATASASAAPSESHKAAAMDLLVAMRLPATIPETAAAMIETEVSRNPGLLPYRDVMAQWLTKYMTWEAMAPELTKLYVATYSEGELKELATFYRSPVGQKSLAKMPELMQETAMIGARLGQPHSEELKQAMAARSEELQKSAGQGPGQPGGRQPGGRPSGERPPSPPQ